MPKKKTGKLYRAKESFTTDVDGEPVTVIGLQTIIREGHKLMQGHEHLFEEVSADYEVEEATAAPGEKRKR